MSTFIETIRRIISDPAVSSRNPLIDSSMITMLVDRVNALTPDVTSWLTAADVTTTAPDQPAGSLAPNVARNAIVLDTKGFEMRLSKFRDGLQSTPRKLRRRVVGDALFTTPADRVRYVLADPTDGVLLLDQNLEIVRTFPGLTKAPLINDIEYANAQTAVTCTLGGTELLIVACGAPQHVVQIYNYQSGALVATIGTINTPGLPSDVPTLLTDPTSVSVDEANGRLFIACRSGNVDGDTANAGFVAEFDLTNLGAITFVEYDAVGAGLYRLNNGECRQPSDVFFTPASTVLGGPPARLWIANGLGDVAAFERASLADLWFPSLVLEAQGPGWTMGPDSLFTGSAPPSLSENAIDVFTDSSGATRLFVAASKTAQVEVFRVSLGSPDFPFGAHEATYGQRGIESTTPYGSVLRVYSTPMQPKLTFGLFSEATGVVADETTLPGDSAASRVLVAADADAGRVQRLRLPVYDANNVVTFNPQTSTVPVSIVGWFLPADASFPSEFLTVEVRDPGAAATTTTAAIPATAWREVPKAGFSTPVSGPAMTRYQFRLRASLPKDALIRAYSIPALGTLLRQSW
jgi:hypothetical protein